VPSSADPTSQQIITLAAAAVGLARSVTVSSCFGMLALAGGLVVPDLSGSSLAAAFKANIMAARVLAAGAFMLGAVLGQWLERALKRPSETGTTDIGALRKSVREQKRRIKELEHQLAESRQTVAREPVVRGGVEQAPEAKGQRI